MSNFGFYAMADQIDTIIARDNPASEIAVVAELLRDVALRRYFFEKVSSPKWLGALDERDYFAHPPDPVRDKTGVPTSFPFWPEALYLARVAPVVPSVVLHIVRRIPENDNVTVHDQLIDVLLALPPKMAATLADKPIAWITIPGESFLAAKIGELVAHIARSGDKTTSIRLARELLRIVRDPKGETIPEPEDPFGSVLHPTPRVDLWQYEELLKQLIPPLVEVAGLDGMGVFADVLDETLTLSRRFPEEVKPHDSSYIWRPAIEEHEQNRVPGVESLLVTAVRDTAESLIRSGQLNVETLVKSLEQRAEDWLIFQRIALHLVRSFADRVPQLVVERLTDFSFLENVDSRHEYALLLRERFKDLSAGQKELILSAINRGPDRKELADSFRKFRGIELTHEELERLVKSWQSTRIAWFDRESLPPVWQEKYDNLAEETGAARKHPEFSSFTTEFIGSQSPQTAEQLADKTVEEITRYLANWKPPTSRFMGPSRDGLGQQLARLVAQSAKRFSADAKRFEDLHPTYVRSFINGLRDAAGKNETFDWNPVLGLFRWILDQPKYEATQKTPHVEEDPDWTATRQAIVHLLDHAIAQSSVTIPFDVHEDICDILCELARDPNPTVEYEARSFGKNSSPSELSLNCVRGAALHALIRYGIWIRKTFEDLPRAQERLARGFDELPKLRAILEERLNPTLEPSLAVRSVYGRWFPWIRLLDTNWAERFARQIFPSAKIERELWEASWTAYLAFCPAYGDVFESLRGQYELAVSRVGEPAKFSGPARNRDENLGAHLLVYYWHGRLDLNSSGLVMSFFARANSDVRTRNLRIIASWLRDPKNPPSPENLERLKALWSWRVDVARADPQMSGKELSAFGWWFGTGQFEDGWAVEHFDIALSLCPWPDANDLVFERLERIADAYPSESLRCVTKLAALTTQGWRIHHHGTRLKAILLKILRSGGEARQQAVELIDDFGRKGHYEYRDLLVM